MTEGDLAEIAERYAKNAPIFGIEPDIPALLAEVRRLRAALVEERALVIGMESWTATSRPGQVFKEWRDLARFELE